SAKWGAEEVRVFADGVFDCFAAVGQFTADFGGAFEKQERGRESGIRNHVTGLHENADDVWALLRVAPVQKKSGLLVVTRENLQQAERVRVVWSVVVGERELLRAWRKAGEGVSVPLARG